VIQKIVRIYYEHKISQINIILYYRNINHIQFKLFSHFITVAPAHNAHSNKSRTPPTNTNTQTQTQTQMHLAQRVYTHLIKETKQKMKINKSRHKLQLGNFENVNRKCFLSFSLDFSLCLRCE